MKLTMKRFGSEKRLNSSTNLPKLPAISSSPDSKSDLFLDTRHRASPRLQLNPQKKYAEIANTACSNKRCGYVLRYAANTNKGQIRSCNEDRISVIINIPCPANLSEKAWPHSSFFGIYDGHGGKSCASYLKDNLHRLIFESSFFPSRPKQALMEGFGKAEIDFSQYARENEDKSGSCALVVMIIGSKCYVASTGDSRAVLSSHKGEKIMRLTVDHKPDEPGEYERIIQAGGSIVTHSYPVINAQGVRVGANISRIVPGNIAVSRSIGDYHIKAERILTHLPDVKSFRLTEDFDFIVMASDGVFDKLTDREVCDLTWKSIDRETLTKDKVCFAVEDIMKNSLFKGTEDNISVILIVFKGIKVLIEEKNAED